MVNMIFGILGLVCVHIKNPGAAVHTFRQDIFQIHKIRVQHSRFSLSSRVYI
jgi:hypothetical protein